MTKIHVSILCKNVKSFHIFIRLYNIFPLTDNLYIV